MSIRSSLLRTALAMAAAMLGTGAGAAPCAGFSDVQDTDTFCSAVEWLRNRQITLGCTPTQYCPGAAVSRAAMALFLNRLGSALSSQLQFVENEIPAGVDPDVQTPLCATGVIAAAGYARQVLVSIAFGGESGGDLGYSTRPLARPSGGSWTPLTAVAIRESVTGAAWTNSATSGIYSLPANQTVQFAVGVVRESGTADFSQGRCQLVANVLNAN